MSEIDPKRLKAGHLADFFAAKDVNPAQAMIDLLVVVGHDEADVREMGFEELATAADELINLMIDGEDVDDPLPRSSARTQRGRASRSRK